VTIGGFFQSSGTLLGRNVTFGGIPATVVSLNVTQLIVQTPAHAAGFVDVAVVLLDGGVVLSANAFAFVTRMCLFCLVSVRFGAD